MADSPLYLRALEEGDLERTYRWHNDPTMYKNLGSPFRYVSRDSEEAWLKKKTGFSNDEVNMAICLTATGEHIGNVYLRCIDWNTRTVEASGIFIGAEEHRGKGYGLIAQYLQLRHAFRDLGLNKVIFYILTDNPVSNRMMEKCGFTREGTLRQHAFKDGLFKDVNIYSVLALEFFNLEECLFEMAYRTKKQPLTSDHQAAQ